MLSPKSLVTTALIASLVALGPLATDMYLPAFPALAKFFGTGITEVQATLSLFMVGFAIAQLLYGPLSDHFGRKPVMLGGIGLFLLTSLAIPFADSIDTLMWLRLLQALGGSAGPVLGRAMVRDIYGPRESARLLSYIGTAMAMAPAVAPILGGYLVIWFGWESIFLFLALYAAIGWLLLASRVPETYPPGEHRVLSLRQMLGNYAILLADSRWRWYSLSGSFIFAGLFSFLSGASFVIIEHFGVAEQRFGLLFALVVAGFMTGTLIGGRLARSQGFDRLILLGASLAAIGGSVMGLLMLAGVDRLEAIIGPHMLYMVGVGIVMPQSMAGALAPYPRIAGTSSALMGFLQMGFAALVGMLVGQFHDGTPHAMVSAISLMGLLTLFAGWRVWLNRNQGSEEELVTEETS